MTAIDDLAAQIQDLRNQVAALTRPTRLDNASIEQAGTTVDLATAATAAAETPATIAGLQDLLDANEDALTASKADVDAAIAAAQEASDAGVAAGELASQAADDALAKAQEALDAAASAGGGATYTNRAPTASDPGTQGKQWFVWDSNYHITAYYVYDGATNAWVATVLDDGTFGNLSAGHITSGYIDAARIAAASLTAAVLAADTLTSREIGADAILARNIKAAEITGDKIAARTIAAGNIQAGTITGNEIKANTLTAQQIQAGSITANEINLDSLNGKTITGATIRSAASGKRIEILNTQMNVYGTGATVAAQIDGQTDNNNVTFLRMSAVSNVGTGACYVQSPTGVGNQFAWQTAALFDVQAVNGFLTSGAVASGKYFAYSGSAGAFPVIDVNAGVPTFIGANYQFYDGTKTGDSSSRPVSFASSYGSRSDQVTLTASDFKRAGGSSIVPAAGTVAYQTAVTANGGSQSQTISFPSGRFTSAPVVTVSVSNSRLTPAVSNVTATGFTFTVNNWTTATANAPFNMNWQAVAAG